MIGFIIGVFVGVILGVVIMALMASLLNMTKDTQMDSEEYSLGQENKIVVIEDVAGNEGQEEKEE